MRRLVINSHILKDLVPGPLSLAMHNFLSWNAVGLTVLHAVLLLFTGYMEYTVLNLLVPFTGPFSPFWVGLGIIGTYLMIITTVTFYMRQRIGYGSFHAIHYLAHIAFVLALLHSWFASTDTPAMEMIYLSRGLIVFFLTVYRVLVAPGSRR
jgi:predicted ferric reductase